MSNLHPLFAGILAAHGMPESITPDHEAQLRRAAYVSMLRRHDWSHELSDDASVYRRGRQALEQLRQEQRTIDPDFSIWNRHCADRCKNGKAYA